MTQKTIRADFGDFLAKFFAKNPEYAFEGSETIFELETEGNLLRVTFSGDAIVADFPANGYQFVRAVVRNVTRPAEYEFAEEVRYSVSEFFDDRPEEGGPSGIPFDWSEFRRLCGI